MLDAIADFWKPAKKNQSADKINPADLQPGSSLGFGFVPQASLSGRRMYVVGLHTYRFGEEKLISFQLAPDKQSITPHISMIIAEAGDEQYLAISRRISINDRMKLFNSQDLENVVEKVEVTILECKDALPDFKGWTVPSYKREMQKMTGYLFKGDYRREMLPQLSEAEEFKYTLLVSENNEHAIEIEKYKDGRMEVYATIYRRISDIGEVNHPARPEMLSRPDLKLATEVKREAPPAEQKKPQPEMSKPVVPPQEVKKEPVHYKELENQKTDATAETPKPEEKPKPEEAPKATASQPVTTKPTTQQTEKKEKTAMANYETSANGALKETTNVSQLTPANKNHTRSTGESGSIECELRVANRIIDEAIRNEMRLSDVVRRIIELPVAEQEVVHLPVTLSDEDYALLAIRYGVSASDKNAIRARIIEDLGSFSGDKAA